tara:strand:- start:11131 stop:11820 length:690 start_codon:yes stop_codon:yes gene_type:complete
MQIHAQSSYIKIGSTYNLNIYAPYTYSKSNDLKSVQKKSSRIWDVNMDFKILEINKFSLYGGISYLKKFYKVLDVYDSINYLETLGGNIPSYTVTYFYKDKPDLIAKSHSLGLSFEAGYLLKKNVRYSTFINFKPTIYFLEWYKASYQSKDNFLTVEYSPLITELPRNFFLSSINSQLIYRITLLPKTGRTTFTGKVSLGANIFSDWSQFKRYAWLGVGLELGFLGKEK